MTNSQILAVHRYACELYCNTLVELIADLKANLYRAREDKYETDAEKIVHYHKIDSYTHSLAAFGRIIKEKEELNRALVSSLRAAIKDGREPAENHQ